MAQLASEHELNQVAPPPGRELEVSIEPEQCPAAVHRRQGDVLAVHDAEWRPDHQVDPPTIRVHAGNIDRRVPAPTRGPGCKLEMLSSTGGPWRMNTHRLTV